MIDSIPLPPSITTASPRFTCDLCVCMQIALQKTLPHAWSEQCHTTLLHYKALTGSEVVQGHAPSRLHVTKGPEADREESHHITSADIQAAVRSVEMTDLEASKQAGSTAGADEDEEQHLQTKKSGAHVDGRKHVHMADAEDDGSQPGKKRSPDVDRKKKLWDDMLKRKIAANLETQEGPHSLEDHSDNHREEDEDRTSRVNSQAALLGDGMSSSAWIPKPLSPDTGPSALQQQPSLERPRLLSKQGLLGALSNSRKFLPGLMKKDGDLADETRGGGPKGHSGVMLASSMETAGSVDSNAPLLPAGMASGQGLVILPLLASKEFDRQCVAVLYIIVACRAVQASFFRFFSHGDAANHAAESPCTASS